VLSVTPGLDLGDTRVTGERGGDVDADAVGRVSGEIHCALDQVVASDAAQRDPRRAVPALYSKRGNAVQAERHRVGWLDRIGVVVLHRIDDDVIDRLAAAEVDLHPVGIDVPRIVVPAAADAPVGAGAHVVDDCGYRIVATVCARGAGDRAAGGQCDVGRGARAHHLRKHGAGRSSIAGIARVACGDAMRRSSQRAGAARGGPAVAAAGQRDSAATADRIRAVLEIDAAGRIGADDSGGERDARASHRRIGGTCKRRCRQVDRPGAPGFDLGDAGVTGERGGDVDADAVGRVRGEIHRALDQCVAADAAQRDPGCAVPALHGKRGDAVQAERHRVARLDRVGVVVLHRIDDDVIDRLAAAEVDLHPVGPCVAGGIVPAPADAPVGAGAVIVDDRGYRIVATVCARGAGDAAIAGQRDIDAGRGVDDLRQRRTGRRGVAGVAAVGGGDAVGRGGQRAGAACGGPAVAAAGQRDRAATADRVRTILEIDAAGRVAAGDGRGERHTGSDRRRILRADKRRRRRRGADRVDYLG